MVLAGHGWKPDSQIDVDVWDRGPAGAPTFLKSEAATNKIGEQGRMKGSAATAGVLRYIPLFTGAKTFSKSARKGLSISWIILYLNFESVVDQFLHHRATNIPAKGWL
jgi:hypothetical protein